MSQINLDEVLIEPNKGSYSESIFYKTLVFESINYKLSTKPMLENYKYRVQYSVTLFHTERHKIFINWFKAAKTNPVVHPLWSQAVLITANANDTTTIQVEETAYSDFKIGDKVAIYLAADNISYRVITDIQQYTISIDEPISVMVGMLVIPTFIGYVKNAIETSYSNERYITGKIVIEELQ